MVLDGSDGTLCDPVDLISKVGGIEVFDLVGFLKVCFVAKKSSSLLSSPIRELVDSDRPGVFIGVVLLNEVEVVGEDT